MATKSQCAHWRVAGGLAALLGVVWTTGAALPPKRSTHYNGASTAKINYGDNLAYDSSVAMTIEAWVYREDASRCEAILGRDYTQSYWLGFCSGHLRFYRSGGSFADAGATVPACQWSHVAVSYDGAVAQFFIDGQPVGKVPLTNAGSNRLQSLWLGGDRTGYNFLGNLDEVRIWMAARSQAEIQADMFREVSSGSSLAFVVPKGGFATSTGTREDILGILPRELIVPRTALPVTVDGNVDASNEYADAERMVIRYRDGLRACDAIVSLVYREDTLSNDHALYVGITHIGDTIGGWARSNSLVALNIDPDYSRNATVQTSDFRVRGWLNGDPGTWGWGNGFGDFRVLPLDPLLVQVAYSYLCSGEFSPPCMEFRIDRGLLGQWTDTDGIMIGHYDVNSAGLDFLAPGDAMHGSPGTWTSMSYGEFSRTFPTASIAGHVYDKSATNPAVGHQLALLDADTESVLAMQTTLNDGSFSFAGAVPADHRLRVLLISSNGCRYLGPQLGTNIQPIYTNTTEAIFPGCSSGLCTYGSLDFYLRLPVGPLSITNFSPNQGAPRMTLRDSPLKQLPPERIRISGARLHPYIRVYLYGCLDLPPTSSCVLGRDYFEAPVVDRDPNETWVDVEVPEVPQAEWLKWWGWVVKDNWDRPGVVVWNRLGGGPFDFSITPHPYPLVYGFEFRNADDVSGLNEFEGVYGENAFIPLPFCIVWDPLYLLWFPIYKIWMDNADGSCNGMSATSLLMYHGDLTPASFGSGVHYPAGLLGGLNDAWGFPAAPKPDTYIHHDCDPDEPRNLWAHIRVNHGVQTSDEYVRTLLDQVSGIPLIAAPLLGVSLSGDPLAVVERIRRNPTGYVISMVPEIGRGHVVAPYAVVDGVLGALGPRILVYDNNTPGNSTNRFIEVNRYNNSYRFDRIDPSGALQGSWFGNGMYAIPIDIWRNPRHAPGLFALADIMSLLVFGEADTLVTGTDGGQWGWKEDGSVVDNLKGARAVVPTGDEDSITRNVMVCVPSTNPPASVQINVHGSHFYFHAANGGSVLQLEQHAGVVGDEDAVTVGSEAGLLKSFRYTPQRTANNFNARLGITLGDRKRAVFDLSGFYLEGGKTVEFKVLPEQRGVELRNDTGGLMPFTLSVQSVDGESGNASTNLYAGSAVPPGAVERLLINDWPKATQIRSEIDLDRDGSPDRVAVVLNTQANPQPEPPALNLKLAKDQIELTWPLTTQAYYLQRATRLGEPTSWITLNTAPVIVAGTNVLTLQFSEREEFFRLHP